MAEKAEGRWRWDARGPPTSPRKRAARRVRCFRSSRWVAGAVEGHEALAGADEILQGGLGARSPAGPVVVDQHGVVVFEDFRVQAMGLFEGLDVEPGGFEDAAEKRDGDAPIVVRQVGLSREDED